MDSSTITIVLIFISALVATVAMRIRKDKCLRNFSDSLIFIESVDGEILTKGILTVENTGLELRYPKAIEGGTGLIESSYLLFKHEYPRIQALVRFHDELSDIKKKERERDLSRTYHPTFIRRLSRRAHNLVGTVKDSLIEAVQVMFVQFQKTGRGLKFQSQEKYIHRINSELIESVGNTFDPLLEKYIGHRIILEMNKADNIVTYSGVLKEYTANYIEIMDVPYAINPSLPPRTADIIVPQKLAVVRHLGEIL